MQDNWKCILCALLVLGSVGAGGQEKSRGATQNKTVQGEQQAAQKYRNMNYNFTFEYPAGWSIYEGFDGNGVSAYPPSKEAAPWRPTVGVGGSVGQPSDKDETRPRTLLEDLEFRLKALSDGPDPAKNVVVLGQKAIVVQGLPGVVSTIRFQQGAANQSWILKQILLHSQDDTVTYHLSLMCHPDDVAVLTPAFDQVVRTFRILGPPA